MRNRDNAFMSVRANKLAVTLITEVQFVQKALSVEGQYEFPDAENAFRNQVAKVLLLDAGVSDKTTASRISDLIPRLPAYDPVPMRVYEELAAHLRDTLGLE